MTLCASRKTERSNVHIHASKPREDGRPRIDLSALTKNKFDDGWSGAGVTIDWYDLLETVERYKKELEKRK